MANNVFANGREISCKKADGKSICCFPDVCFTPPDKVPPTPPGVPIPYPNTGMAKDTTSGSKKVKISDQEILLKNKSYFKTSVGNEAGCATKKGIVTSKTKGKVYFTAWSMDVKVEGENVVRHLDLTTHNHGSATNTAPWPYVDSQAVGSGDPCEKEKEKVEEKCSPEEKWQDNCPTPPKHPGKKPKGKSARKKYKKDYAQYMKDFPAFAEACKENECLKARKCKLVPYKPDSGCCPGQTGDHVIDAASFLGPAEFKGQPRNKRPKIDGWKKYNVDKAPCCCAEGPNQTTATHGQLHVRRGVVAAGRGTWSRQEAASTGAKAICKTFPDSMCSQPCLEAQINNYHDEAKTSDPEKPIKAKASMTKDPDQRAQARADMFDAPASAR